MKWEELGPLNAPCFGLSVWCSLSLGRADVADVASSWNRCRGEAHVDFQQAFKCWCQLSCDFMLMCSLVKNLGCRISTRSIFLCQFFLGCIRFNFSFTCEFNLFFSRLKVQHVTWLWTSHKWPWDSPRSWPSSFPWRSDTMLDSCADFFDRAVKLGVTDPEIQNLKTLGYDTFGKLAFATNFTPGQADESSLVQLAKDITGVDPPPLNRLPVVRRPFFESYTLAAADMQQRLERKDDSVPRKLATAERAARYHDQVRRLAGIDMSGELEPSNALIDLVYHMTEEDQLRYVRWEECTKRDQELMGIKSDPVWKPDSSGLIRETKVQAELQAETDTDLKLRLALQRRSLAFDQARLCDYNTFERWTQVIWRPTPRSHQMDTSKSRWSNCTVQICSCSSRWWRIQGLESNPLEATSRWKRPLNGRSMLPTCVCAFNPCKDPRREKLRHRKMSPRKPRAPMTSPSSRRLSRTCRARWKISAMHLRARPLQRERRAKGKDVATWSSCHHNWLGCPLRLLKVSRYAMTTIWKAVQEPNKEKSARKDGTCACAGGARNLTPRQSTRCSDRMAPPPCLLGGWSAVFMMSRVALARSWFALNYARAVPGCPSIYMEQVSVFLLLIIRRIVTNSFFLQYNSICQVMIALNNFKASLGIPTAHFTFTLLRGVEHVQGQERSESRLGCVDVESLTPNLWGQSVTLTVCRRCPGCHCSEFNWPMLCMQTFVESLIFLSIVSFQLRTRLEVICGIHAGFAKLFNDINCFRYLFSSACMGAFETNGPRSMSITVPSAALHWLVTLPMFTNLGELQAHNQVGSSIQQMRLSTLLYSVNVLQQSLPVWPKSTVSFSFHVNSLSLNTTWNPNV